MKHHFLKSKPAFFSGLLYRSRSVEIRFDDRNFMAGDLVSFVQVSPPEYKLPPPDILDASLPVVHAVISSVFSGLPGLRPGYVLLALEFPFSPAAPGASADPLSPPLSPSSYYDVGGLSVIDVLFRKLPPDQFLGFLVGNIIKYGLRLNHKPAGPGAAGPSSSDASKLAQYSSWLSRLLRDGRVRFGASLVFVSTPPRPSSDFSGGLHEN